MTSFRGLLQQAAVLVLLCVSLMPFASTALAQEGMFIPTGSLNAARAFHTATLLNNGTVLVAGGQNSETSALASAELYDPTTGTFTATGSLNTARLCHTATLLNDGMVFVAGGQTNGGVLASAELYDPTTGTFTPTGSLNTARLCHTATLLNSGMVLIAGGYGASGKGSASAELYNPTTGTFTPTGSLTTGGGWQTATLLNNGTVLVAGGDLSGFGIATASAELYDPSTGTFTPTGSLTTARFSQTATLLNGGMVLIAGGDNLNNVSESILASAELYDPSTGTFTPTGSLTTARYGQTATLLNGGMVLIAGGHHTGAVLASAELYDPTMGTFTPTGSLITPREFHTAILLNSGRMLAAGGEGTSSGFLTSAELYELVVVSPASLSFSDQVLGTTSMSQAVTLTNHQSTALSITSIAISGTNAPDFAETDNCIGSVPAGASCSIHVTFTPAAAGSRTGSLNIANNTSGNPLTVSLAGAGVTATRIVGLSASSLTFTDQIVGSTSAPQGLTLSNTGNSALIISSLGISGTNASEFAETDNCGGSVAAGASCTINVTFSPTAAGTRTGTVYVADNATSPTSPQTVTLTGTATAPSISVTPSSIAFPAQYVGTSGLPQSVTVMNNGNAPLSITSVTASPADFGLLNACGSSVAAGASCAVGVFFDPTASGTRTGTLTVNDNAPGSPHTVALSGSGQDFSLAPVSSASTTVSAGQTANFTLAVSPAGGFNQTVGVTCAGAPSQSTCAVTPSSIVLNGSTAATVAVAVTTTAASRSTIIPFAGDRFRPQYLVTELLVLSLLIGLPPLYRRRRPRFAYGLALLLFLCAGVMMSACGGGSSPGGKGGTPTGNYTLTVSGTFTSGSTALTHKVNLNLVVQ